MNLDGKSKLTTGTRALERPEKRPRGGFEIRALGAEMPAVMRDRLPSRGTFLFTRLRFVGDDENMEGIENRTKCKGQR